MKKGVLGSRFSQGAAVVLYAALRLPHPLAAVVSLHGWMPRPRLFEGTPAARNTPVLMCHGEVRRRCPHG